MVTPGSPVQFSKCPHFLFPCYQPRLLSDPWLLHSSNNKTENSHQLVWGMTEKPWGSPAKTNRLMESWGHLESRARWGRPGGCQQIAAWRPPLGPGSVSCWRARGGTRVRETLSAGRARPPPTRGSKALRGSIPALMTCFPAGRKSIPENPPLTPTLCSKHGSCREAGSQAAHGAHELSA